MILEVLGTLITIAAVIGVLFNNRRRLECFYIWLVTNGVSAGIHIAVGVYSLAARDAIFFVLAIEGLVRWRRMK